MGPSKLSTFWKNYGVFIGFVGATSVFLYPIFIYPILHVEDYKKIQEHTRKGINQEEIQPGGMKIWSDPFGRK